MGGHRRTPRVRRRDPGLRRYRPATRGASSAESVERCLTPRTKADRHGRPLRRHPRHGRVAGGRRRPARPDHRGRRAGHRLDAGTGAGRPARSATSSMFSFHGTKTLTTGEGGMLVTDQRRPVRRGCRGCATTAARPNDHKYFVTEELGYKYRMSSLQAAFGRAQLQRIDELLARKRQIFGWYEERLARRTRARGSTTSVPGDAQHVLDGDGGRRPRLRARRRAT